MDSRKAISALALCIALALPSRAQDSPTKVGADNATAMPQLRLSESAMPRLDAPSLSLPALGVNPVFNIPDSIRASARDFSGTMSPSFHSTSPLPGLNPYSLDYSSAGAIYQWEGGGIYGASSRTSFPALGNMQNASVTFTQQIDRFTFSGSLSGAKYHFDRSLYNDYGISGRMSYHLNDKFSLNLFGSYSANNYYHSMASMPYMGRSSYGSSVTYQASDKFGIELGAQRYFDPFSNRWITVPVVAPSVRLWNNNVKIDFGGLIYRLLDGLFNKNNNYGPGNYSPRDMRPMAPSGSSHVGTSRERFRHH